MIEFDLQYLVAALIVLSALAYVGVIVKRQLRSFSKKPGCEADCGCSSKSKEVAIDR